jgi:hypothetical protein
MPLRVRNCPWKSAVHRSFGAVVWIGTVPGCTGGLGRRRCERTRPRRSRRSATVLTAGHTRARDVSPEHAEYVVQAVALGLRSERSRQYEGKNAESDQAREQTFRLCMVKGSERMLQNVTKGDDRGRECVMAPRHGASVFQIAGSDSLPLGCTTCRELPVGFSLTPRYHAAVTSCTDSITLPALAAYWRSQLYIRYNRGGTETLSCHAGGNFSSY